MRIPRLYALLLAPGDSVHSIRAYQLYHTVDRLYA